MACGKSEAARHLTSLGAAHIDADAISRALTAPGGEALPAIRNEFGDEVFASDGILDRPALAELVFSDADAKRRLEAIIHPLVWSRTLRAIDEADSPVAVLDVPLLFESGMDALCGETWTLSVDAATQIRRIRERDGLTEAQARARLANQLPMAQRNARATRVIDSDRPIDETRSELSRLYRQLLERIG